MSTPTNHGQREGARRRDEATALVERYKLVWTRRIQRGFVLFLVEHQTGTTDDIRPLVDVPPEAGPSVWGAAVNGLRQARIIRGVGHVTSSRPERHGCEIKRWTLLGGHAAAYAWLAAHPELPGPDGSESGAGAPIPSTPAPPQTLTQPTFF